MPIIGSSGQVALDDKTADVGRRAGGGPRTSGCAC